MEGEAQAADLALGLFLHGKAEAVQTLSGLVTVAVDIVQQIVVKKVHTALFQLLIEDPGHVLRAFVLQTGQGELGGQQEAVTGMALGQRPLYHPFALAAVIEIGGVEVGEAPLQKQVHHGADLVKVDGFRIVRIQQGESHAAKA